MPAMDTGTTLYYGKVESIGWVLPLDDTNFRIYVAGGVIRGDPRRLR